MNKHFFVLLPRMLPLVLIGLFSLETAKAQNQEGVTVDMSLIDGMELTPANIFSYRLQQHGTQTKSYLVKGSMIYRKQSLSMNYEYRITLQPGITQITPDIVGTPTWTFSSPALRELFQNYNKLPQGTYEYCVSLVPVGTIADPIGEEPPSSCVYQTVDDLFLINLITPENDAKIYEFNPMLAWVVNYPFASELTYRLRVAELKQGQNPQNAITRNNPMYQERNVTSTGMIYPVTARPLQKWQPYVWTVDAYYKGLLLGGAEVWKFTIVDDSVYEGRIHMSYIDVSAEQGQIRYNTSDEVKLMYNEQKFIAQNFIIQFSKSDHGDKWKNLDKWKITSGENYITKSIETLNLKHNEQFFIRIIREEDSTLISKSPIKFKYLNPIYAK